MNYEFPQKNHWRNRIWNQLFDRVKCHPRDAVVLYLAAEQDLDRATAVRKGFHENNLIAIDRDKGAVEAIRKRGRLAIHGDFFETLFAWPEHTPVAAVIADFTCGMLDAMHAKFGALAYHPSFSESVMVVNMLRGRDAGTNNMRRGFACCTKEMSTSHLWGDVNPKSRSAILYTAMIVEEAGLAKIFNPMADIRDMIGPCFKMHLKNDKAIFGSYPSGPQRFDWGIWNTNRFYECKNEDLGNWPNEISGQIAAVLAHRTRRLAA